MSSATGDREDPRPAGPAGTGPADADPQGSAAAPPADAGRVWPTAVSPGDAGPVAGGDPGGPVVGAAPGDADPGPGGLIGGAAPGDSGPGGPYAVPPAWPAPVVPETVVRPDPPRRTMLVAAASALVLALLGAPLGLLWAALAPGVPVVRTEDSTILINPQPEEFIAADGWFSLLGLGFGVLAALAVWVLLRRQRGPVGLVVLLLGGVGAGALAWRLGRRIGLARYRELLADAAVGQHFRKPPDLRAGTFEWLYGWIPTLQGDVLLPAFGAVVTYTLLAGWSRYGTLRPETEPVLSWDSAASPAPTAEPAPPGPGSAEPTRG